ncbi:MAG: glycosyltransferase family 9 protein [Candidatus Omnitrophota bacterium]|jgi:lipopolysaccharide heptosyltransferase II
MELPDIKKILVINLGGIGDLLLSLPALEALKWKYPQSRYDILLTERASELLQGRALFDTFYFYKKGLFKQLRLFFLLRQNRYDLVINMRTMVSWVSALKMFCVFRLINPRISAGRNTQNRGWFFNIKIPEFWPGEKCEMEYDIEMAAALGAPVPERSLHISIAQESYLAVSVFLEQGGIKANDRVIGIHPGGEPSRRWPVESFSQVIAVLNKSGDFKFVITGSLEESSIAQKLASVPGAVVINAAGKLNLNELTALIARCSLYISNDTGPMHIAAVLKTPLVALFGPGSLCRFDPRNIFPQAVVLYQKAACAPCNKMTCHTMRCLKVISPDAVVQAALKTGMLLKKAKES